MVGSSGGRGDPVAASSDGTFENRLSLAFDAQIDRGLYCSTALSAQILSHSKKERNACFRLGTFWLVSSSS